MNQLPIARSANITVQNLDNETLIYDLTINKAFMLNETSAFIWNHLDGQMSIAELSRRLGAKFKQKANEEIVWLAIEQLKNNNLLKEAESFQTPLSDINRREVIKRAGLATMIALPIITGLTAPQAAHAASNSIAACQPCSLANPQCASGNCAVRTFPGPGNGSYCSLGLDRNITNIPGDSFTVNSAQECSTQGALYCCSGSATYTVGKTNSCACNA